MKLFHLAAALALCAACQSTEGASGADGEQKLELHREFANAYFDQGDYLKAEAQVDLALALAPRDVKLRLMKAFIGLRRGTPASVLDAEQRFRELASGPDYRARLGLAETLERKGVMYSGSADAVERGERPTPAKDLRARAAEMRGIARDSWKEAVAAYSQVIERKSGEIPAINGLQRTHALLGNYQESLKWSDALLDQSVGEIAFWKKQLERPGISAEEEARLRALLGGSTRLLVETRLQASTLLYQLGQREEALAHLDQVLELDPENVQTYSRRALLRHQLGRPAEAKADLEEFLRRSTLSIEHADMQRALELLGQCDSELKASASEAH